MKRLFALLLVCMLSISFSAVAEDVDVKSLDNDALVMLYTKAQAEVIDRGLFQVLPSGVYNGAGDLPKGLYVCQAPQVGTMDIYGSLEEYKAHDAHYSYYVLEEGEMFTMRLYGDLCYVLKFNAIILSFTPATE